MLSVNRDEFRRPFDVTITCSLGARRHNLGEAPGGTPYICHIGVCRPNGYGFCAVLVFEGTTGAYKRITRFNFK